MLSDRTQRRAVPRPQRMEIKILNISFPPVKIEPTQPVALTGLYITFIFYITTSEEAQPP